MSPSLSNRDCENCDSLHKHDADVLVVGAGVLGCSVAVALGRQGRKVLLLERNLKEPDRIVGELLQPGGVEALAKLGMSECLEGIDAVPVRGYEVIYLGERVHIPYEYPGVPTTQSDGTRPKRLLAAEEQPKPQGRSFHHGRFVQNLRAAARKVPNIELVETTAKRSDNMPTYKSRDWYEDFGWREGSFCKYFAPLTIVADGHASKFRKELVSRGPVAKSKFWGLVLKGADLPRPEHGHVVVGNGGPILLYQISKNETRILVDVSNSAHTKEEGGVKAHLHRHVMSSIPESIKPMFEAAYERGGWRCMPNEWLPPSQNRTPGAIVLGDAMNIRHPLTGGGMTVAINDALLLSEILSPERVPDLANTNSVLAQMRKFHWKRKKLDSVINILAQALYSLFAADDAKLKALQRGCFRYFQHGGNCVNGPVGLLAGIIHRPIVLVYHFFVVALLSMWITISESKIWLMPLAVLQSILVFGKACQVLFPFIIEELQT